MTDLANKIEDLIAEFGDDPKAALECISEYLSLRRHAMVQTTVDAERHERAIEIAREAIPAKYFWKEGTQFNRCGIWSDDVETIVRAYLEAIGSAGTVAQEPVAFLATYDIARFDVNGGEIHSSTLYPKGTLRPENEFPVFASPQPAAVQPVAVKALEWKEIDLSAGNPPLVGWEARTPFMTYTLESVLGRPWFCHFICAHFADLNEAKAAVQADYETRIRSALACQENTDV